jgi:hypothetical protein
MPGTPRPHYPDFGWGGMGRIVLGLRSSPGSPSRASGNSRPAAPVGYPMPRNCSVPILPFGGLWEIPPSFADEMGLEFYEDKIRPVPTERCDRRHSSGEKALKGGRRLDGLAGLRNRGDSGTLIAPDKSDESLLIDAIAHEDGADEMPPDARLPDCVIADFRKNSRGIDQPIAGLLIDLRRRGLLHDTLVIWGGEFGRTPVSENGNGRYHNPFGFTEWMASGGVKGGHVHGATDEFGFRAVEGRVGVHDLHATILHLLGLDHEKLTGRDFRLTDVSGEMVREIIA